MEQPKQFTTAHRKAVADMFKPYGGKIRERALNDFSERHETLKRSLVNEYVKRSGGNTLAANIVSLKQKIKTAELNLQLLGLEVQEDSSINLRYNAPDAISDPIDEEIEKQLGTRKDVERKCDDAYEKVWLAQTPEDVQSIVSGLFAYSEK